MCCVWDTYFLKLSYIQQAKLLKKKIIAKTLGQNTFSVAVSIKVFVSSNMPWHMDFSKLPKS